MRGLSVLRSIGAAIDDGALHSITSSAWSRSEGELRSSGKRKTNGDEAPRPSGNFSGVGNFEFCCKSLESRVAAWRSTRRFSAARAAERGIGIAEQGTVELFAANQGIREFKPRGS